MTSLVIDASVWVAAADATDRFSEVSRAFLLAVAERGQPFALHDFAGLEIACALSRRLGDGERARALTDQMLRSPLLTVHALSPHFIQQAVERGTTDLLRAGDALYAALAHEVDGEIVSWDGELISRAGAVDPEEWLRRAA